MAKKDRPLTETQYKVLMYLKSLKVPPTIREMSENFGWTFNGAVHHLNSLETKGYVKRIPNKARNVRVTSKRVPQGTYNAM